MRIVRDLSILLVLILSAGTATGAAEELSARDVPRVSLEDLMDVRITSPTRMEQPIGEIAADVTIVVRADIEAQGHASLREVLEHLPGMYVLDNTESLFVGVRGNVGGGVLFLLNGVPLHPARQQVVTAADISQFDIPVEAIDRIEIVRSPVTTVYGNGAFQGLVNVVTNDHDRRRGLASATYGSRESSRAFVRVGWEGDDGSIVANVSHRGTAGLAGRYEDMLSVEQMSVLHSDAVGSMDGGFGRTVDWAGVSGRWQGFELDASASQRVYGIYPTTVGLGGNSDLELDTWQASLAKSFQVADRTALRARTIASGQRYDLPSISGLLPTADIVQRQTTRRVDLELELEHRFDRIDQLVGYRLRRIDDVQNDFFFELDPADGPVQHVVSELEDQVLQELFTHTSWRLGDRWRLSGGFRYQHLPVAYERDDHDRLTGTTTRQTQEVSERNPVTGRASLQFSVSDQHRMRVQLGSAQQFRQFFEIDEPEEITSAEIGHTWTTGTARLATSFFVNDIDRIVLRTLTLDTSGGASISRKTNNGRWRSAGLEMVSQVRLGERWRWNGSFVAQRTWDRAQDVDVGYSPALTAKSSVAYTRGRTRYGVHGRYVGAMKPGYEIISDAGSTNVSRLGDDVPGYFTLGVNVRHEFVSGVFAALHVSNAFDAEIRHPANEIANMERGLLGMGRIVTLSLGSTGF